MNPHALTSLEAVFLANHNATITGSALRGIKHYLALMHILKSPQGVSENSINAAAGLMSGRNVPADLAREHRIKIVTPRVREKAPDSSRYSVYQLLNSDEARTLTLLHCGKHRIPSPSSELFYELAAKFPDHEVTEIAKSGQQHLF